MQYTFVHMMEGTVGLAIDVLRAVSAGALHLHSCCARIQGLAHCPNRSLLFARFSTGSILAYLSLLFNDIPGSLGAVQPAHVHINPS
jgi:hypothetical protein